LPVHPGENLMSLDQYKAHLCDAINRYNREPQCGEWLRDRNQRGLSPAEAWSYYKSPRPMCLLDERLQYLTALVEREQKVTIEGVTVRIGGWMHRYRASEKLGRLLGQRVKVRFNPEFPERVHVAPVDDEEHPFTVPLVQRMPARSGTRNQFEQERIGAALFVAGGRPAFLHFRPPDNLTVRNSNVGASRLHRIGEAHNRLNREGAELQNRRNSTRSEITALATKHRIAIQVDQVEDPDETLRLLREAEESDAAALIWEQQQKGPQQ
jgi:hypothetical protein